MQIKLVRYYQELIALGFSMDFKSKSIFFDVFDKLSTNFMDILYDVPIINNWDLYMYLW